MQKPSKKIQTILLGITIVVVIIFINSGMSSFGTKKGDDVELSEVQQLEKTLMKIKGIGEVALYLHFDENAAQKPLTDYFSITSTSKKQNQLKGILVIAEGAEDLKVRSELSRILSVVLQLPEHRIVIVEMKKRGITNENE